MVDQQCLRKIKLDTVFLLEVVWNGWMGGPSIDDLFECDVCTILSVYDETDDAVHLAFGSFILLVAAVVVFGVIRLHLDFVQEVRDLLNYTVPISSTVIWYVFLRRALASQASSLSVGERNGPSPLG